MYTRKIFKRKKSKTIYLFFGFFIIIIFFFYIFFILDKNKELIVISENKNNFYIIPTDRGGEKVQNLDKKSLNLKSEYFENQYTAKPDALLYSIQIFVDDDIEKINDFVDNLINLNEAIFIKTNFYILALNTEIGLNYFLLYKNFESRELANSYCFKYLTILENCLIVDTSKF